MMPQILVVDWSNLKRRLIGLFGNPNIKEKIINQGKKPTQVLNYKYGDHIYNLFLSFLGETNIEKLLDRNIRILIYGAWELDAKWFKKIISFLEGREKKEYFSKELVLYLWKNGFLSGRGLKRLVSEFLEEEVEEPDLWEHKLIGYLEKYKPFVTLRKGVISLESLENYLKKSFGRDTYIKIVQKRVDMLMGIDMATYSFNLNPLEILLMCNDQDILPALKIAKRNGAIISFCFFEEENVNETILCHSDRARVLKLTELNEGIGVMRIMNGKYG